MTNYNRHPEPREDWKGAISQLIECEGLITPKWYVYLPQDDSIEDLKIGPICHMAAHNRDIYYLERGDEELYLSPTLYHCIIQIPEIIDYLENEGGD